MQDSHSLYLAFPKHLQSVFFCFFLHYTAADGMSAFQAFHRFILIDTF